MNEGKKEYWKPSVTTDVILIATDEREQKHVLLIKRKNPPFQNRWAFPGGFLDKEETLKQCAVREMAEETGVVLEKGDIEFLLMADAPDRDPRGRTISAVYLATGDISAFRPQAADDAADVEWFPLNDLPPLAFDHDEIIRKAIEYVNRS